MHSYALVDPVYRQLVRRRQADYEGLQDKFCLQCHTAIGTRGGDIQPNFEFDDLQRITLEGVTCESCHKVSSLERPYNSGHVLDPDGPVRGSIQNPLATPAHESEYSPLHDTSSFCGGCHDIIEVSGLNLERPFAEWQESPAAADGQNCQSCHMPTYEGEAVEGTGEVRTLHRHRWVGVDVPLTDGYVTDEELAEIRTDVETLLSGAASISLTTNESSVEQGDQLDVFVTVKNNIPAHNFPTGSTFLREAWIELVVRDGGDNVIYETGTLDANGDLRSFFSQLDPYGDDDLLIFHSGFVDEFGMPVVYSWDASEHFANSLSPLYERTSTLFIPTGTAVSGPLKISARIRFRSFSPYLLRALSLDDYVEKIQIYEVDSTSLEVPLVF